MRLKITQLKAPWPSRAKVGDIIELPTVPLWAAGKCEDAGGAAVTLIARSGNLQNADDQPARVFVTNPAGTQADPDNARALGGPADQAALRAEIDPGEIFVPLGTVTGNGSGEALPTADSTVKAGKTQK